MTRHAHLFGLGLRKPHYRDFLAGSVAVDFVEVISENFMVPGGRPRDILRRVRRDYRVAMHGVSMSVGSADGLDEDYLRRLKALADEIEPFLLSDHLCWTRLGAHNAHDLLPMPYDDEALDLICDNVDRAQEVLGRTLLIENPSSYVTFATSRMTEWEFLAALCRRTGCVLLIDVNNIHVSAINHGFSGADYLAGIPMTHVRQVHLAGHMAGRDLLIDTHDQPVSAPVWQLLQALLGQVQDVAVMIERDDNIPPLDILLAELDLARDIAARVEAERSVPCA
ncbi:hypothetical protein J3E64_000706 [Sphingobium sp. OAS761]|uniref:MNIO family bufferin maturase n=1 Tax=Sphingobium sp. OAS761 TaxID=2817901 RepID=UPI0020A16555|nr:DUF692 domain-containing protein [Sphingobium sp. OAS761]MCP1469035.1 hypothetical protein [Sphingobium sp. OAS761]